ncbi:MAG: ABC transporter ATP-binding protein [Planctomycetaceae bacterium]|jgi:zinc transport system ATP-binding protein|nr:ABC transporter ATP-binding protein [Planctomycetaceae bacterium]
MNRQCLFFLFYPSLSIPAVHFEAVSFSYGGPVVVENASFEIEEGGFVSIVGPNGGGKTTLVKLMLGLLLPQKGTVQVFGKQPAVCGCQLGYTPQFLTVDFSFPLSVLDVVLMGRIRSGQLWYSKADRSAARNALETMQLTDSARVPFRHLSGGQRQRVLIARAVCGEPDILVLDEPTNNIDSQSEEILYDILMELNKRMTIVMVSHDIGFVSRCVTNVICVNRTLAVHSTAALDGKAIHELYGHSDMKMVIHKPS